MYTAPDSVADEARSSHQDQGGRVGPGVLSLEHVCDQELGLDTKKVMFKRHFAPFSPVSPHVYRKALVHGMRQYRWSCAKHSRTGSRFQEVWQRWKLKARIATHLCQWSAEHTNHKSLPLLGFLKNDICTKVYASRWQHCLTTHLVLHLWRGVSTKVRHLKISNPSTYLRVVTLGKHVVCQVSVL